MNTTYSISGDIFTINIKVEDFNNTNFGIYMLELINKSQSTKVICDFSGEDIIQQKDIKYMDTLVSLFKFNNIKTIVCGINATSASVLFHFLDDFKFQTALNVQRAIDDFKHS